MKTLATIFIMSGLLFSGFKAPLMNTNHQTQDRPGTLRTSEGGWSMLAKFRGKVFKASSIYPPAAAGRIVGYYKDGYIGLPYNNDDMVSGKKITFSTSDAADLAIPGESGTWGGNSGEMEITKVAGGWIEGKFHFTGKTYRNKQITDVTEGFFRIKK